MSRCKRHCLVWGGRPTGGELAIGCPHCGWVKYRIDVSRTTPRDQLKAMINESRDNHTQACTRTRS